MTRNSTSSSNGNGSNGIFMKIVVAVVSGGLLFCFNTLYQQGGELQAVKATSISQQKQIDDFKNQMTELKNLIENFRKENRDEHKDLVDRILDALDIQHKKLTSDR